MRQGREERKKALMGKMEQVIEELLEWEAANEGRAWGR